MNGQELGLTEKDQSCHHEVWVQSQQRQRALGRSFKGIRLPQAGPSSPAVTKGAEAGNRMRECVDRR